MKIRIHCGALLCAVFFFAACNAQQDQSNRATLVLRGGVVHTVTGDNAQAVAVEGDKIVFVGNDDAVSAYVDNDTTVVELDGRLVLPGLIDAHLHPLGGAMKEMFMCNFPFSASPDDVQQAVARCVAEQADAAWITGGQWDSAFFDRFDIESPKAWLDAVSGDKAVFLSDDSGHNGWGNSKALQLAGVTADTPNPAGGTIQRMADGEPNGVFLETAQGLVYGVIPKSSDAQFLESAEWFSSKANAFGLTAIKAAAIEEEEIRAFKAADEKGTLNLRIATSIRTPYGQRTEPLDYDEIDRIRDTYRSELVDTGFVKIFLDGVPTPARTAAMLQPYLPDDDHGANFDGGPLHVGLETLTNDLIELERRGYTVKIHTAGDRSVRIALDAIAAARDANGDYNKRHELSHAGYIHADDLPRFAKLNAVADLSPIIWHPSPIIQAVLDAVGEDRGKQYWPVRDLLDAKAPVLAGSDWPSAVPDANPWIGIEAFVTRADPREETSGTLWLEQAITLDEAIEIYTLHGARALRLEDRVGSIEVGKLADLIVLEKNIFEIPITDVGDTRVDLTFFAGAVSYERNRNLE